MGGGPTGVEFAGELADFVRKDLAKLDPNRARDMRITLIEADQLLSSFDARLREYAALKLTRAGVHLVKGIVKEVCVLQDSGGLSSCAGGGGLGRGRRSAGHFTTDDLPDPCVPPSLHPAPQPAPSPHTAFPGPLFLFCHPCISHFLLPQTQVRKDELELKNGAVIPYGLCVWSTGVGPTSFSLSLPFEKTMRGRLAVDDRLRVLARHADGRGPTSLEDVGGGFYLGR